MKVLHLCPLWYPIARDAPGGIETFLARLVRLIEELGCECTLLASGDSRVETRVVPVVDVNLCEQMKDSRAGEYAYYEQHQLRLTLEIADAFDVIHSHVGHGAYVLSALQAIGNRVLHTAHTPVTPDLQWFVRRHPTTRFSTVSEFQARQLRAAGATHCEVIYNGVDVGEFKLEPERGEGLFFIGRMEWGKGPDLAVRVARELDRPLVLAGPVVDQAFFDRWIRPFLDERIRYVGVVNHHQKNEMFGQAGCVVLPFRHSESFGLVSIEAMACGTPVVSLANGALPEIIEPGVSGYLAGGEGELAPLVTKALALPRARIRDAVSARFDLSHTAAAYRRLYQRISEDVPAA